MAGSILASIPWAGDHHTQESLRCSDCHVMHFSQQHGYQWDGSGSFIPFGGPGPNRALLRNGVNDLCLSCHDGSPFATDVLDAANTGSQAGAVRLGGYLSRLGLAGFPENGHTLDSVESAAGSNPDWSPDDENEFGGGLSCVNCHAPHGTPGAGHPTGHQYRNLRSDPGNGSGLWVTYNDTTPGLNDLSRDVFLRRYNAYDEADVDWNEPNPTDSAIARWCGGCHSFVHDNDLTGSGSGLGGTPGILQEHPVFDENLEGEILDLYNTHTNKVKVMSEVGFWDPASGDVTPTCITCHRGHGNGNPDGLIYRSGTGLLTEDGDSNGSNLDHLCGQCHAEGSAFAGLISPP